MSYKRNIASNFITQIIIIILMFFSNVVVSRVLGPEGKGYLAYFLLIFQLIAQYGNLGINQAVTYFQKKTDYKEDEIYNVNTTFLIIIFIIIFIIITCLRYFNIILIDYDWILIISGVIYVLFSFIETSLQGFYIGKEKIVQINRYNIISKISRVSLIVVLWILGLLNIYTFFGVMLLDVAINTILKLIKLGINYIPKMNFQLLKAELKYGIVLHLATLFVYLTYRVDQVLIKILGMNELGIYSVGVSLAELVFLVPSSVMTALSGKLFNIKEKSGEGKYITSVTIKFTIYSCFIIVILGIIMTPLIPIIYGESYKSASMVTIILFVGVIFASVGKVAYSYVVSIGKPGVQLIFTAITLIVNLIINIILIPRMGINGAALASSISYLIYGALYIVYFTRKEKFNLKDIFLINKSELRMIYTWIFKK